MLNIFIVTCVIAVTVLGKNDETGSGSKGITGPTWVEIAARNVMAQVRGSLIKNRINEAIERETSMILKPYYEVELLSNETKDHLMKVGMKQIDAEEIIYQCRLDPYRVPEGLQNITRTKTCVDEIMLGRLLLPSGVDQKRAHRAERKLDKLYEKIRDCEDQVCIDSIDEEAERTINNFRSWPINIRRIIDIYPLNYENAVLTCLEKYNFISIRPSVIPEMEKRRNCFQRLIKDNPTWSQRFIHVYNGAIRFFINLFP